jgi:ABC-type multidrug transport system fused ATPase/permease subunit
VKALLAFLAQFERRSHIMLAVFAATAVALEIVSLLLLSLLVLTLLNLQSGALASTLVPLSGLLPTDAVSLPSLLVAMFFAIVAKNFALAVLWRRALACISREQAKFAVRLFEQYLRMPYPLHLDRPRMTMQHNLNIALNHVFLFLVLPGFQIALELAVGLAILIYLLSVSPWVTLALAFWLAATFGMFRAVSNKTSIELGRARRQTLDRMLRIAQESLVDIRSVKIWGRESFFTDLFGVAANRQGDILAKERFLVFVPRFLLEPMLVGALLLTSGIFFFEGTSRAELLSEISILAAAAIRLLPGANRAFGQSHLLASQATDLQAIWLDLAQPVDPNIRRPSGALAPAFDNEIRLNGVSLRYGPETTPVLRETSLTIRRGERIAIAGPTGSGKTSLLNILLGLISPDAGTVLIDGQQQHPLLHFRQRSIAFVPQDVAMLDDTIMANVIFGSHDRDEQLLWRSLGLAALDGKVRSLPQGIHTVTGENGIKLSGGERQRLALARALYQRPTLLVLDEATSQLDLETEHSVLDSIVRHIPDLTIVMVTHRMDNARIFPRRYRLSNATLVPC